MAINPDIGIVPSQDEKDQWCPLAEKALKEVCRLNSSQMQQLECLTVDS